MSKRREALRQGIRSLIHDTSRELADLKGREMPAEVDVPDALPDPGPHPFADESAPAVGAGPTHAEVAAVEVLDTWSRVAGAPTSDLEPPAAPEEARAVEQHGPEVPHTPPADEAHFPSVAAGSDERPSDGPLDAPQPAAVVESAPAREAARFEAATAQAAAPVAAAAAHPAEPASDAPRNPAPLPVPNAGPAPASEQVIAEAVTAAAAARATAAARPARKRRARRRSRKAARRGTAPMPPADGLDGVDPAQAQSRKGVCVAYFVDHACWRVPNAYCNTALHVCVKRDCPVYHLHQVALERRFASKYRHFW